MSTAADDFSKLRLIRRAARILRYHTMPPLYPQSVGEHTFGVIGILDIVAPNASKNLWRVALFHDVPEAVTGDTPATAKWQCSDLSRSIARLEYVVQQQYGMIPDVTSSEYTLLKFCDLMELSMFCIEEADDGNSKMVGVAVRGLKAISDSELQKINDKTLWLFDSVSAYLESKHLPIINEAFHGY